MNTEVGFYDDELSKNWKLALKLDSNVFFFISFSFFFQHLQSSGTRGNGITSFKFSIPDK